MKEMDSRKRGIKQKNPGSSSAIEKGTNPGCESFTTSIIMPKYLFVDKNSVAGRTSTYLHRAIPIEVHDININDDGHCPL